MNRFAASALVLGCAILAGFALWSGVAATGRDVAAALWVLPALIGVQLLQLYVSALSWRTLLGKGLGGRRVPRRLAWRLRLVREGIDSLLPVAQVGGELVAVQLLAQDGVAVARAGAATTLDLLAEAAMLPVVVLAGTVGLWLEGGDVRVLGWVWAGTGLVAIGLLVLAAAHFSGGFSVLGRWWARWGPRMLRVDGFGREVDRILASRMRLFRAACWHLLAWSLGAAEVWLALWAIGCPVGAGGAFVVEAFGVAARGAGFAIPASLGVQDGGYVLAAGLFGVPAEAALAMAALKRLREALIGGAGLLLWHRATRRLPALSQTSTEVGGTG